MLCLDFHGATIFLDEPTGVVWIENQVSIGSGVTVLENIHIEE